MITADIEHNSAVNAIRERLDTVRKQRDVARNGIEAAERAASEAQRSLVSARAAAIVRGTSEGERTQTFVEEVASHRQEVERLRMEAEALDEAVEELQRQLRDEEHRTRVKAGQRFKQQYHKLTSELLRVVEKAESINEQIVALDAQLAKIDLGLNHDKVLVILARTGCHWNALRFTNGPILGVAAWKSHVESLFGTEEA
jgi:chromosome segregation ATPase